MPNKIESLPDGKIKAQLETGEIFEGDPLEVTTKLAEAQVNTKRWGQGFKSELETLKATPPTPPPPATPEQQNEAQLQAYLLDQQAKALGYANGAEYKAELQRVKNTTDEVNNQLAASSFLAQCQDFPNTQEAIDALSNKIDERGWGFDPQSMIAAHALCLREGKYQPLSEDEQRYAAGDRAAINQQRGVPPPMIRGNNPETNWQGENDPYKLPLDELRKRAIRQQLEGKG